MTLAEIKAEMKTIGDIIDDRSLYGLPLSAYAERYRELEILEKITAP
jgi:hypothetical protein